MSCRRIVSRDRVTRPAGRRVDQAQPYQRLVSGRFRHLTHLTPGQLENQPARTPRRMCSRRSASGTSSAAGI